MPAGDRYPQYVLGLLFLVYVFNFIDRQILSILIEPIKADLGVSDTAMGFLTGFAFALFYTFAAIPIARLADTRARRTIIAVGLAIWSAMTALSGVVRSFAELALARIGVGIGEAALVGPAHSLLADYFPPQRRATALAVFSMGIHVGIAFGFLLGGWMSESFGWRRAFFAVGLPGLVLAMIVRLTVREPPRGHAEGLRVADAQPAAHEVATHLWRRRSFRHIALAAALHSFGGYAFASWGPPFFMRVHGMSGRAVGAWLGVVLGVGGAFGSVSSGLLADRIGARDARRQLYLPALAALAQIPFVVAVLMTAAPMPAMLYLFPSAVLSAAWFGPVFSLTQGLAEPRMRATAAAILVFVINIIGLGLGPLAVGMVSDALRPSFGPDALRWALLVIVAANLWAAVHFFAASRTIRTDLVR